MSKRWSLTCAWTFVVYIAILLSSSSANAQTAATGALSGTVTDPQGAAIANATVTITNSDTGQSRTGTTSADGTYKFGLLAPGNYRVQFEASGFRTSAIPSV
ncbi:MAG: carboxypeptidase-like regulatory domain-containing protein, partial [Candidatus Acidiferrales bacterium]